MEEQAIKKIEQLVKDGMTVEVDGRKYTAATLQPVIYNPKPGTLVVHNLRGFCGFINNDIDNYIKFSPHLILVNGPKSVELVSAVDGYNKRTVLVMAKVSDELKEFPFGRFLDQEDFIIAFRSLFVPGKKDDFEYVLSYASKLVGGVQVETEDDGVSQKVGIRKSVNGVLKEKETLKAVVKLSPYRTFREAEQPESEFLFRVRLTGDTPMIALFEADGGAWVNQATENVVQYIQTFVKDISVIA